MGDWHALTTGPLSTGGGSPDMLVLGMNSKRQRRPSVRLGEIGDQSAALTHEAYLKRKEKWEEKQWKAAQEDPKGSLFQQPCGFSKQSGDFAVSSAGGSGRAPKSRPIANPVTENHHVQTDTAIEIHSQEDPNLLPQAAIPDEPGVVVSERGANAAGKKIQLDFRAASKRGRHGKRKRGGIRGSAAVVRLTRGLRVSPECNDENEKGSGEDGIGEPLSNASYDIYTPEGFRDSDLETSESPGYVKETSLAVQGPSSDARIMNLGPSHGQQMVRERYQNERDEFVSEQRGQAKLGETWIATSAEGHIFSIMDRNILDFSSGMATRSKQDANGILIRELKVEADEKTIPNNTRQGAGLASGVRAWLNGLGLGRYAPVFEMHEVDTEVLHLLTLDDLREMGINAVGSRRKMYAAIQQLGKGFPV